MTFPMFDRRVIFFCTRCFWGWLVKSYEWDMNNGRREYCLQDVQIPKAYIKLK